MHLIVVRGKLFILMLTLFLTGCSVEYNLEIDNELNFKESIILLKPNIEYDDVEEDIDGIILSAEDGNSPFNSYEIQPIYLDNESGIELTNSSDQTTFLNSNSLLKNCYDDFTLTNKDDVVIIQSIGKYSCSDRYDGLIKFSITTTNDVIYSNADSVSDSKYTWNINPKAETQKIYIEMTLKEIKEQKDFDFTFIYFIILMGGLVTTSIIGYKMIIQMGKRNNRL
jgi:hypothetical protein